MFFHHPVDISKIPQYSKIIKNPMSFSVMLKNIESNVYLESVESFFADLNLICQNAITYNFPISKIYKEANVLKEKGNAILEKNKISLYETSLDYYLYDFYPESLVSGVNSGGDGTQGPTNINELENLILTKFTPFIEEMSYDAILRKLSDFNIFPNIYKEWSMKLNSINHLNLTCNETIFNNFNNIADNNFVVNIDNKDENQRNDYNVNNNNNNNNITYNAYVIPNSNEESGLKNNSLVNLNNTQDN